VLAKEDTQRQLDDGHHVAEQLRRDCEELQVHRGSLIVERENLLAELGAVRNHARDVEEAHTEEVHWKQHLRGELRLRHHETYEEEEAHSKRVQGLEAECEKERSGRKSVTEQLSALDQRIERQKKQLADNASARAKVRARPGAKPQVGDSKSPIRAAESKSPRLQQRAATSASSSGLDSARAKAGSVKEMTKTTSANDLNSSRPMRSSPSRSSPTRSSR